MMAPESYVAHNCVSGVVKKDAFDSMFYYTLTFVFPNPRKITFEASASLGSMM